MRNSWNKSPNLERSTIIQGHGALGPDVIIDGHKVIVFVVWLFLRPLNEEESWQEVDKNFTNPWRHL